mmetsp:Transcript_73694/g.196065  ORF Transcript_73694/g.196065 Transcript_73694/m.196065 type:complete len:556 (-) Transcript_73694:622-2289(-)
MKVSKMIPSDAIVPSWLASRKDWWNVEDLNFRRSSSAPAQIRQCVDTIEVSPESSKRRPDLFVVSWNIASPNNNPFEYWSMHECTEYNNLMVALEACFENPSELDQQLRQIFTNEMYYQLRQQLSNEGLADLDHLDAYWFGSLSKRRAVSEFLKDVSFGEKRLISMPDRMTNILKNAHGETIYRPSPITGCITDLVNVETWWSLWKDYMFKTSICLRGKILPNAFAVLDKISRSKYPALDEAEEAMSRPLQTLCLALFDAVFTQLLFKLAPDTWQPLKRQLHENLYEKKAACCISLLHDQYLDADIIFVQEASEAFAARASVCLNHAVLRPTGVDGRRSQMSLILAKKSLFVQASARDVTEEVLVLLKSKCVDAGDLCVFKISSRKGKFLLASFHGDSNGRSTGPVLAALDRVAQERYPDYVLIFGLDANPPSDPCGLDGPDGRWEMEGLLAGAGMSSCWAGQDLRDVWTTFSARTYLQPQLHKAVPLSRVMDPAHRRLKDWILFYGAQVAVEVGAARDNTGRRQFEARVMPSRGFPSDHALVSASLVLAESAEL